MPIVGILYRTVAILHYYTILQRLQYGTGGYRTYSVAACSSHFTFHSTYILHIITVGTIIP